MSRFSQIVFSVLFSLTSVATNLNSHCVAQEKLRIDTETVAVQKSPWEEIQVSTKSSLHGLHVVNKDIIWASGDDGTTLLSTDGGVSWRERKVEDPAYPDGPLLVDIHGFDDAIALAISAETPAKIYSTTNGGLRWKTILEYPGD